MPPHICNAYCRGAQHARVMWWPHNDTDDPSEWMRQTCESLGVVFVALEPAPEAQGTEAYFLTGISCEAGYKMVEFDQKQYDPLLLVWREP